jgi:hypothetical protein
VHWTTSLVEQLATQAVVPVDCSAQQVSPAPHGVPGQDPVDPELEPVAPELEPLLLGPPLLPPELPVVAPLELAAPLLFPPPELPAAPLLPFVPTLPLLPPLLDETPPSPELLVVGVELPHAVHPSMHAAMVTQPNEKDTVARTVMALLRSWGEPGL